MADFSPLLSFDKVLYGIVDILHEQLRATLELQRHPGTTVTIIFTELTYQSRS